MVKCQQRQKQKWAFPDFNLSIILSIIITTSTAAEGDGHQPSIVCANYWRDKAKEENKKGHQGTVLFCFLVDEENICLHIVVITAVFYLRKPPDRMSWHHQAAQSARKCPLLQER